ncbi:RNA helicase family protein [Striga asiatica]|uniref:RNA helicase family protein n=1 Tax=Striga asiatica TaxID=4170 RepID=A0A5A7PH33_STRAF|nr:RNA helicase family protein [Striga asiatica]
MASRPTKRGGCNSSSLLNAWTATRRATQDNKSSLRRHSDKLTEHGTSKMLFLAILLNYLDPALTLACASNYKELLDIWTYIGLEQSNPRTQVESTYSKLSEK